jgi:hypothetical protein
MTVKSPGMFTFGGQLRGGRDRPEGALFHGGVGELNGGGVDLRSG